MADENGLSDQERAELEELRAEKAAREQAQREAAERAELDRLRRERAQAQEERERDARDAAARERGREFMEPDEDDLKMPKGQKITLAAVLAIAIIGALLMFFF